MLLPPGSFLCALLGFSVEVRVLLIHDLPQREGCCGAQFVPFALDFRLPTVCHPLQVPAWTVGYVEALVTPAFKQSHPPRSPVSRRFRFVSPAPRG